MHRGRARWKRGTLHGGAYDVERLLYRLGRKGLNINNLEAKAQEYVEEHHISAAQARNVIEHIKMQKRVKSEINDVVEDRGEGKTVIEESKVGDSQSNGTAERAVRTIEGQLRKMLLELEEKVGVPSF